MMKRKASISFPGLLGSVLILLLAACGGPPGDDCPNTCIANPSTNFIGCDSRMEMPEDVNSASTEPWSIIGAFYAVGDNGVQGHFCTGTLIADRFVLTAAHCMVVQGNNQLGFALAQEWLDLDARPYGTHGVRRVYIPSPYDNQIGTENIKAYDYAVAELWAPIAGATPASWGYIPWNTLDDALADTAGYPEIQPDDGLPGSAWRDVHNFHDLQPFKSIDGGNAGLLYTYLDGTGGQSGSPIMHLTNSAHNTVTGVFVGSPVDACQLEDQTWAARLMPASVTHIENVIENDPGNWDFWWNTINIPFSPTSGPGEAWP